MSHLLTGVSYDLVEEFHYAMLHDNMNMSCLLVHVQQVEESRLRRKNIKATRAKSFESGSSKGRLKIQDNPRFKKRFSNQVSSKFPKDHDDRVSKHKSQKSTSGKSPSDKPTCSKCGKNQWG